MFQCRLPAPGQVSSDVAASEAWLWAPPLLPRLTSHDRVSSSLQARPLCSSNHCVSKYDDLLLFSCNLCLGELSLSYVLTLWHWRWLWWPGSGSGSDALQLHQPAPASRAARRGWHWKRITGNNYGIRHICTFIQTLTFDTFNNWYGREMTGSRKLGINVHQIWEPV